MMLRFGFVYFKDPLTTLDGMDTIRWMELCRGLANLGYDVEMISEDGGYVELRENWRVRPIHQADWSSYDVVKTTHHSDIFQVPEHPFLMCRLGRVVDDHLPPYTNTPREHLLAAQAEIARRARYVVLMSEANILRWQTLCPQHPSILFVPNGCPQDIPAAGASPYTGSAKRVIYFGSLTSSRFVSILNAVAKSLKLHGIEVHHVGRNQLNLYQDTEHALDESLVHVHGSVTEEHSWNYLHYADAALMIARNTLVFDNEISKVYYLLRAGVPVISEQYISTNSVILETQWGEIVPYNEPLAMSAAVLRWVNAPRSKREAIGLQVARDHSWSSRCAAYDRLLRTKFMDKFR